jgi:hypothetical protein
MTTHKEALKLALEALENSVDLVSNEAREAESLYGKYQSRLARVQGLLALEVAHEKAITAIKEALAQPEQEPVAVKHMMEWVDYLKRKSDYGQHLQIPSEMSAGACWDLARELEQFITTPPQRKPLTTEQIWEIAKNLEDASWRQIVDAIEAAHGIKE